ncbi:MAG TPA: ISNCY family transposase [Chthoniobacterales bacterium]|nr:ISNCY family transposase [Chthoniobacterales bacterium]
MIGKTVRPASLFAFAFFKEVAAITDPVLDSVDLLLEDPSLLALSTQVLTSRSASSNRIGREGIAPDRLLRCVVLKHIKGWSYRQLHRELRASLLYRRFTRFYEDPIPDFSNLCRAFALFGKEGTEQIHQRIVQQAKEAAIIAGRKLRTDTTAVETNIHYPTDSSLLADSLRVMSRCLQRIAQGCQESELRIVNHGRAAKHRVLEIGRAARTFTQAGQEQFKQSYKKLIGLTQGVRAQAAVVLEALNDGRLVARKETFRKVVAAEASLKDYLPLVEKVITQSRARIFQAQTRHPDKILSLFEPHSVVIRKGKAHKPNEFGRLIRIDEVENGLVSNYAVAPGNLCDQQQWMPALEAHVELFGRAPQLAAADRGFWSSANEKAALELGVKQVVLPSCGRLSTARAARQKQRWFRRGQGWRAGIEARLSTLKHCFGMRRALYKGEIGFERHVGWCIIAHNLVLMSRARMKSGIGRCRSG